MNTSRTAMHSFPTIAGKAILLGEHFVVYGAPALALSIPGAVQMRAYPNHTTVLEIPQWDLRLAPDASGSALSRAFDALLSSLPTPTPVRLEAQIRLPSGVGLGSSASLGVAVLRAFNALEGWNLGEREQYDRLFAWERVFHGEPSGFDHAAVMHTGLTRFERYCAAPLQAIALTCPIHAVIAQVDQGASTRDMVAGVRRWRDAHPEPFEALLLAARERASACLELLRNDSPVPYAQRLRHIGTLLCENHTDLQTIGVSTDALDNACKRALDAGAMGAKLIGAGGGGCVLALVEHDHAGAVESALTSHCIQTFSLHLPDGSSS